MYRIVGEDLSGMKVLDLACGDGIDAEHYRDLGGEVIGLDASEELIKIAKEKYPEVSFICGVAEKLPFDNNTFDAVFSKYAIMTSADMNPIFDEAYRVLKPKGTFIYLVTHPFRQFMERRDLSDNYFEQKLVDCLILNGTVILQEPTHTMNEYLNKDFFRKFEMIDFIESHDPAAEQIYGGQYPCFFVVKSKKK